MGDGGGGDGGGDGGGGDGGGGSGGDGGWGWGGGDADGEDGAAQYLTRRRWFPETSVGALIFASVLLVVAVASREGGVLVLVGITLLGAGDLFGKERREVRRRRDRETAAGSLTELDRRVMAGVARLEGPTSVSELAFTLDVDPDEVQASVDRLHARRLLREGDDGRFSVARPRTSLGG